MRIGKKKSGGTVLRHRAREGGPELVGGGCSETIEAISAHLETFIGPVATVYHEIVSDLVHVDVHLVPASAGRPYHALVTSGMSDRPMTLPPDLVGEVPDRAEVMILLPPEWPIDQASWHDERHYWPIRTLKVLARLPHEYDTWLGAWHSLPNGDPAAPYAEDTAFCGVMLAPPLRFPPEFGTLRTADGREITLLAVLPLLPDELAAKIEHGADVLLDGLDEHGVNELLAPRRGSVLRPRD